MTAALLRLAVATLAIVATSGCAKWAYSPTWKGVQRESGVSVFFTSQGATCGDLTVKNRTDDPITVYWKDVRTVLPSGQRDPARLVETEGRKPVDQQVLQPDEAGEVKVCLQHRTGIVRPRPITGFDIGLGWYFGTGVLAGNIWWRPKKPRMQRIVGAPRQFGFDLVVPVRDAASRQPYTVDVRGEDVTAYKYKRKHQGPIRPLEPRPR